MPTGFGWQFKTQYAKSQWEDMKYEKGKYGLLIYEKLEPRIVRLTFNRPERKNALNDQLYNEFLAGLHEANDDPQVKVVIIRGAGTCFGSGHDLSSPVGEESPPIHPSTNPTMVDYYGLERRRCGKQEDVLQYPKALIAQVHGFCVGAQEMLASMCDVIIAADNATFGVKGFGRMTLGVCNLPNFWPAESNKFWGGTTQSIMVGKPAVDAGFITKVVKLEQLEAECLKWAKGIAELPLEVIAMYKEWFHGMQDIIGLGTAHRNHYLDHLSLQYVRFRPDEVNMYKVKKEGDGVSSFVKTRAEKSAELEGKK
jgi:enoyl-CoA hydratase